MFWTMDGGSLGHLGTEFGHGNYFDEYFFWSGNNFNHTKTHQWAKNGKILALFSDFQLAVKRFILFCCQKFTYCEKGALINWCLYVITKIVCMQ